MAEEAAPMPSLKARIAALNIQDLPGTPPPSYGQATAGAKKRPPPPLPSAPPPRLSSDDRSQSTNNPPLQSNGLDSQRSIGNQPAGGGSKRILPPPASNGAPARPSLPPRPSQRSVPPVPSLPPRRPSEQSLQRKESVESISTVASGRSSMSARTSLSTNSSSLYGDAASNRVKAPAYDPSKLPPLPPKRTTEEQERDFQKYNKVGGKFQPKSRVGSGATPAPSQPPSLPERPALPARPNTTQPAKPRRSALEWGLNKSTEIPPQIPSSRPGLPSPPQPASTGPPPIPLSSRPDLAALQASKPKPGAPPAPAASCLKCRDFRAVDAHAARFPRQSLPSTDIAWLTSQLTTPFPSPTDKARALFVWLHHNIAYNTVAFFAHNVKPSTPASTIATGLAVCEGYAALFAALAAHAALDAVVVGGHGKGYGHSDLAPGAPVPPFSAGHAWNAVRIDGGRWKLIDACWGAGQLVNNAYRQNLAEEQFTMDNEEFGRSHYPQDKRFFFREDGAVPRWEDYICAPPRLQVYGDAAANGIAASSFSPPEPTIAVNDAHGPQTLRFAFAKKCPHWDSVAQGRGKPFLLFLQIHGPAGDKTEYLPLESDGVCWWLDVRREVLGRGGQRVHVAAMTKWMDGAEGSGRGVSRQMWEEGGPWGLRAYGFLAGWDLV